MGFISGILASVLEWCLEKLGSFIAKWIKLREAESNIEAQAEADKKKLENAHTPEEKHDAAETIVDHTFGS